jgi:hypothetical protein
VSIQIFAAGVAGRYRGVPPRSKVSMMNIRRPQHGQGRSRQLIVSDSAEAFLSSGAASVRAPWQG